MQRRRVLGKRLFGEFAASGFNAKRNRSDQEVPTMEDDTSASPSTSTAGTSSGGSVRRPCTDILAKVPRAGTPVERNRVRTAGPYVIGHELGTSPGVPQTQYLARKENTSEFYLLKILSYDIETELVNKETQQGKTLLHTEYTLLSLLADLDGVIHHHGLFCDYALEEKQVDSTDLNLRQQRIYTGRLKRRLILVLDCVHSHEFCERSAAYVNLQKHVQTHKFSEIEALMVFYEIVKVVEQLHQRNVIHRDLKLNNIVLNRRTNKIVITNFFLAKHLNSEDDNLFDQRGSPAYISPDVLGGKPYKGKPSDVWALGVILYTIIYGKFPFLDTTPSALFKKIRQADYVIPVETKTSPLTIQLIKSMLTLNPSERFTATEVRIELERSIVSLLGPRIEIDQIVPEVEDLEQTADERNRGNQQGSDSKPTYPSHELSRESFSRVLESGIHRRENESFLRPRSLVTRVISMRNNSTNLRGFASGGNRLTVFGSSSPRSSTVNSIPIGRNRPTNSNEAFVVRTPNNRPELVQVRLAPINTTNGDNFVTMATQNIGQQQQQQPPNLNSAQQQSVFVHVDAQALNHIINFQTSNAIPIPIQAPMIASPSVATPSVVASASLQNPGVQNLFSAMNDMFARGRMPPPSRDESPDFQGIITLEMANKIVTWLLANFRNHAVVREIFGSTSGNKVNNVLELLRRFGVQMESRGGTALIKVEQTIDILMFMTYLLQVAGMNNNYFLNSY
ncbi:serine/threonine-protein kinase 40-like [Topomyia yanbarensis]|uniref:serine/threonine-protein kinase 40-like n=1 Tax=Topomyia yanbarensis TaxID=2498891 RepID=UPI00273CCBB9|nr:serine/threonine-protein kinase 40-like [Topomyia yanbarensis]